MDSSFFAYLQQLELMAFFSGYPLLYAVVLSMAGKQTARNQLQIKAVSLLPYAYALTGTLYIGLQLKNLYPDYSFDNIKLALSQPYLQVWGLLAVLFWIPAISKKPVLSLLHSLVFFFLLLKDLVVHSSSGGDRLVIKNDMNVYTESLLVNSGCYIAIVILYFIFSRLKNRNTHS